MFQMFLFVPVLTLLRPRFRGHNQALRKKEKNRQRSREFHQQREDAELMIEEAFAVAIPIPPPPPMFSPASPSPISALPPPPPPPAHRAVRRLALVDISESSSAPNLNPNTSPPVDESRPEQPLDVDALASPASPINQCTQFEQQNEPVLEKVGDWLRSVKAANEADDKTPSAETSTFPTTLTMPAAPRKDQHVSESDCSSYCVSEGGRRCQSLPAKLVIDGKLFVHKDYTGRLPLCYYSTGLQEGSSHDLYECFDGRDIMWARRVRFHIDRLRNNTLRDKA
jgi:hypothetical protein